MRHLKIWFPGHFTEAHRTPDKQRPLVAEFTKLGIACYEDLRLDVDAIFCGTVWNSEQVGELMYRYNLKDKVPLVHYNWDIYPWQVEGEAKECYRKHLWRPYLEQLRWCAGIIVPSHCTTVRTEQFTGRKDCVVVKAPAHLWDCPAESVHDGGYVVDVMRKYPDPNRHAVKEACEYLGIPVRETGADLPWDEFKRTIAGARLLCSGYYEASTGGLTLLEGYALGKPVLLSNSPYMGAVDYFGDRGNYFQWDSRDALREKLYTCFHGAEAGYLQHFSPERRKWVEETYNDANFAKGCAEVIRRVAG